MIKRYRNVSVITMTREQITLNLRPRHLFTQRAARVLGGLTLACALAAAADPAQDLARANLA